MDEYCPCGHPTSVSGEPWTRDTPIVKTCANCKCHDVDGKQYVEPTTDEVEIS